jgi:hypothetical protein
MIEKDKGMFARALLAGVAIVAIPIVAASAQTHSIVRSNPPPARRTCDVRTTIGTRLGNTVTCRTKEEREQLKKDGRETVERVQMRRVLPGG